MCIDIGTRRSFGTKHGKHVVSVGQFSLALGATQVGLILFLLQDFGEEELQTLDRIVELENVQLVTFRQGQVGSQVKGKCHGFDCARSGEQYNVIGNAVQYQLNFLDQSPRPHHSIAMGWDRGHSGQRCHNGIVSGIFGG